LHIDQAIGLRLGCRDIVVETETLDRADAKKLLRKTLPHIGRLYRSPLGMPGAWITLVIAVLTLDLSQRRLWSGGLVCIGILCFPLYGRKKLVYSPEEDLAVRERQKALGHA
jgi:ethanolamine permease